MVCSEVLPSIRKHGAYITKEKAVELFNIIDNDREEALNKVCNPEVETKLHYNVVRYIRINFSTIIINPVLGENQITHFLKVGQQGQGIYQRSAGFNIDM